MSKKITGYIKLRVPAGNASADGAIGPALRHHGVDLAEFCKAFNEKTEAMDRKAKISVLITVYSDGSFTLKTLTPKAAEQDAARTKSGKFVSAKTGRTVKSLPFVSAKTGRTVKSLPVEPQLGTERIQKVVRSVVRRNERPERVSH